MLNEIVQSAAKVWHIEHIIYFSISTILLVAGLIVIHRFVKKEKTINLIIKIAGVTLLCLTIINRIELCYYRIIIKHDSNYNWFYLIPDSICGMTSLLMSIDILFFKKNNTALHFLVYVGFISGLSVQIYPSFLNHQAFLDPSTISGLLHHTVLLFIACLLFMTKYFIPSIKKWYIAPLFYCGYIVIGLFELQVLKFPYAMNIFSPLVESLPHFTSWYSLGIMGVLLIIIFEFCYEHFKNKKTFKEIISEM